MPDDNASNFALTRKVFEPVETNFVPGERSMVAWISTDCVDHERDVVVSSGIDFKTYFLGRTAEEGNPCVLAFHDFGRWPLGRCEWIKAKNSREFNGLYAKTIFDDDPDSETVWKKIKSRSLRGISIGFRPPTDLRPGEWGPPTKDELLRRPDWKGAERIIRRCVLLEYSVCSLPMNPQALVAAVNKGVHRPVYSLPKVTKMEDETPDVEAEETEEKAEDSCSCGKADCEKCNERMRTKDDEPEPEDPEEPEEPESKAMESEDSDEDPDSDEPEDGMEEGAGFRRGDHVKVRSPHYKGCGVVQGVHRKGIVPHADNDLMASADEPAARVKCYKAMGDGHTPTNFHVAVKCMHMTKMDEPMRAPSKGKSLVPAANSPMGENKPEPLPPLVALSEAEFQKEAIRQSVEASVKRINELFGAM